MGAVTGFAKTQNPRRLDPIPLIAGDGQFAPGSMLPKMQAAMRFVQANPAKKAIITSLYQAVEALDGKAGTVITFN